MKAYDDQSAAKIGLVALMVAALVLTAAMNIQRFPGLRGTDYAAEFSDASGLRSGNMVQIAGIRVGRVTSIEIEDGHVLVEFELDSSVQIGDETQASIEVLNVLGEKFLRLDPAGERLEADATIPLNRTEASYDVVRVFSDLSDTTEEIHLPQLRRALGTVTKTLDQSSEEAGPALDGVSRLARTIASRDDELEELLGHTERVTGVLADRSDDVVTIMEKGNLLLDELHRRRDAIAALLANTEALVRELHGLIDDNKAQIRPMLSELHSVTDFLVEKERDIRRTLETIGPYVKTLGNVVGTGPWFDATAVNLTGTVTGEFEPGFE
jgi:phospholipid/cholesterol/gamma-HCH transport system substrate-binding protein